MAIVHMRSVIVVVSSMLPTEALMMFRSICISIVPLSSGAVIEVNMPTTETLTISQIDRIVVVLGSSNMDIKTRTIVVEAPIASRSE